MYKVLPKNVFVKSLARLRSGTSWNEQKLRIVLKMLTSNATLPAIYKDHQLKGGMSGFRECHVKHNLLLLYTRDESRKIITLFDIGTHDDFFGY